MTERAIYLHEGKIKINEDVYEVIVANKALETKGVAAMSSTFGDGVANLLGRKNETEGVKLSFTEEGALEVNVYVVVQYGYRIPDIALRLQERIKSALVEYTEVKVEHVNIFVQDIVFDDFHLRQEQEG